MMIFDSSFGIDFRQNHLILTFLRRSFGKITLVDYMVSSVLPEGQKDEWEAQAISLINTFASKHQINRERVSISIPREKVVVRFIKLPLTAKENLRKVVDYETSKFTPFEKGETYFDYHVLKEENEWIHLFVVFVKRVEVDYYIAFLKKIGIRPISIQIPSTAALNLFFFNKKNQDGEISVLLDVTGSFFEMNLVQGADWRESFHLPLPLEEKESRIINTFKRSGLAEDSLSKATFFVYGLDAAEKMLPSLRESPQIKGVSPPPMSRIETGKGVLRADRIFSSIGVPLNGLIKTWFDLNLLPFEMRKKVRQIGRPLLVILTCLAILLSVTWGTGVLIRHRNELNVINAEIKKRKPEVEVVDKLQKQQEELRKEISELEKIKAEEISKTEILRELTQILPSSVWVWNFKYNGKEIDISGFADSASDLIPLIDKSPIFEKVEFSAPVTKERVVRGTETKEKERFKIKARLETRRIGS